MDKETALAKIKEYAYCGLVHNGRDTNQLNEWFKAIENDSKPFMLTICPAFEKDSSAFKEFRFKTKKEMIAASNCAADLLLYVQDVVKAMPDYTNSFDCQELIDGEWEMIEE